MVCTACLAVNVSCISGRSKILAVEAGTLTCTACLVLVDYYLASSACFVLSMCPLQAPLLFRKQICREKSTFLINLWCSLIHNGMKINK
jgi:hypothetical protein